MTSLTGIPPRQKNRREQAIDPVRKAAVKRLPCVICWEFDMRQNAPTEVHHLKSGRYGGRKEVDSKTIPLCHSHHNKLRPYPGDEGKLGYHNGQETWERHYGPDHDWLEWTNKRLGLDD